MTKTIDSDPVSAWKSVFTLRLCRYLDMEKCTVSYTENPRQGDLVRLSSFEQKQDVFIMPSPVTVMLEHGLIVYLNNSPEHESAYSAAHILRKINCLGEYRQAIIFGFGKAWTAHRYDDEMNRVQSIQYDNNHALLSNELTLIWGFSA